MYFYSILVAFVNRFPALRKFILSLHRFFKILRIKVFGADNYPPLWFSSSIGKPYKLVVRKGGMQDAYPARTTSFVNYLRVHFWHFIASRNLSFATVYQKSNSTNHSSVLSDLITYGYAVISRFSWSSGSFSIV